MKNFTVILHRAELISDIEAQAFIMGDMLPEEQQHTKHLIQDICQPPSLDRTTRMLTVAFHECVAILGAFVKEAAISERGSDAFVEKQQYSIRLSCPDTITESTLAALPNLLHEFMLWKVLADWTSQILPEQYAACLNRVEESKGSILSVMRKRSKPITLKAHPF